MQIVKITPQGDLTVSTSKMDYEDKKKFLAGWLEGVPFGRRHIGYINEESKLMDMPYNFLATTLMGVSGSLLWPNDYLAGNCVCFGVYNEDDEHDGDDHTCEDSFVTTAHQLTDMFWDVNEAQLGIDRNEVIRPDGWMPLVPKTEIGFVAAWLQVVNGQIPESRFELIAKLICLHCVKAVASTTQHWEDLAQPSDVILETVAHSVIQQVSEISHAEQLGKAFDAILDQRAELWDIPKGA